MTTANGSMPTEAITRNESPDTTSLPISAVIKLYLPGENVTSNKKQKFHSK